MSANKDTVLNDINTMPEEEIQTTSPNRICCTCRECLDGCDSCFKWWKCIDDCIRCFRCLC